MGDHLLTVKGVSKDFGGIKALNGVDLVIKEGTVTALIGPNGSGKTTLINIISGIYEPSGGSISFEENCMDGLPPHKIAQMGIARTFQLTKLFEKMNVLENVMAGAETWARHTHLLQTVLHLQSVRREEIEIYEHAMEVLRLIHIEKLANEQAGNLPHGQQRLVELARALATRPKLMLLDEPAAGLNPHEEDRLQEALRSMVDAGITILLVEHHMRLVMRISDWVYVLNVGRSIANGTPEEIGKNPSVVKAYLGKEY
jgi:ABC-type branched-subunit amino acid transport system ATPase component